MVRHSQPFGLPRYLGDLNFRLFYAIPVPLP